MISIEFMKLACSVQNRPRVRNASQGRYENPLCAGEEVGFCCSDFYLGSISGVSRTLGAGIFFRRAVDEIGNSDHQAIQIGCGA